MRTLASLSLFFSILFTAAVQNGLTACSPKSICTDNNGFCFKKANAAQCTGTVYNKGCSGKKCACCIEDTSICIAKPHCENDGGKCVGNGKWTTCTGAVDSSGCHGDGCACCKDGACTATQFCKDSGGYCFLKDSNHKCPGTIFNKGCSGQDCACCIEDTSICVAKPHCSNANGDCMGGDWGACGTTVDSSGCHGDGCACCRDGDCQPEAACTGNGGYCFENDSNHQCPGTVSATGCGSDTCSCCT